jgi:Major Facilitator Superfamily
MIMPTALALVTNATTENERPRVTGARLGIAGIGTALGPVVGGVLASAASWRWVFLLNVPIATAAVWGGRWLRESRDESEPHMLRGLDWRGVVTVVGGLALISVAIDDVGVEGWTSSATLVPLLSGLALLIAFGAVEVHTAAPLVRPSLLRNRLFVLLTVAGRWPTSAPASTSFWPPSSSRTCGSSPRPRRGCASWPPRWGWPRVGRCPGGCRCAILPGWSRAWRCCCPRRR